MAEWRRHARVLILLVLSALLWVALIYSNSRGGIIASLCQLLFLGVLLDPVRHLTRARADTRWARFQNLAGGLAVRVFLIVCLVGLFAYGVGWVGGESVVSNFQQAGTDFTQQEMLNNVNTSRKEIWSATWQLIKALHARYALHACIFLTSNFVSIENKGSKIQIPKLVIRVRFPSPAPIC